jgi:small subunit ribosomal protein S7
MSRRRRAKKHPVLPDALYNDPVLNKFINCLMLAGKKSTSERIVYGALDLIQDKAKCNPLQVFHSALNNVKPHLEVRSRRVGGATYQVPMEVRADRSQTLAIRWVIQSTKARKHHTMAERLCAELIEASNQKGTAIKKREDTYRMAEANKAFSHYRW